MYKTTVRWFNVIKGTISQAFILLKSADPIAYLLTLKQAQILASYKFNNEHYKKLFNS